jgi:signal transduction histidine kinase
LVAATEPVRLAPVVKTSIERFLQGNTGADVSLNVEPDVPIALAEPFFVSLILENLLVNAAKYSPGVARIEVSLITNDAGMPEILVRDYGIGIAEDDLSRLFDVFYRGERYRERVRGVGLGLPLCKRLVEALDGKITADTAVGGGSIFRFSLRALEQHSAGPM